MSQPAIFLERDDLVTKPLLCKQNAQKQWYVPEPIEACLRFWALFPDEKSMWTDDENCRPWDEFWERETGLKKRVETRIAEKEKGMRDYLKCHTLPKWWSEKTPRQKWRGAVLGITGDSLPEGLFYPDALTAVDQMDKAGYLTCFALNLGHYIDRGISLETVVNYHGYVRYWLRALGLDLGVRDNTFACVHPSRENCACRKPKSGTLRQALQERDIDASRSWLIDTVPGHRQAAAGAEMNFACQRTSLHCGFCQKVFLLDPEVMQSLSPLRRTRVKCPSCTKEVFITPDTKLILEPLRAIWERIQETLKNDG